MRFAQNASDDGVLYVRKQDVCAVVPKGGKDAANKGQQAPRSFDAAIGARLTQRCLYVDCELVSDYCHNAFG